MLWMQLQTCANEVSELRLAVRMLSEPPPPPSFPSIDELAAALFPRVMDAVNDEVAKALGSQKQLVEQILRERAPDLSQVENSLKHIRKAPEVVAAIESMTNGVNGKERNLSL